MVDNAPTSDTFREPPPEDLPNRLRVHQLARALGSTNKEVLEALVTLDGQMRNVQSGVDREDALRVRDLLFAQPSVEVAEIPGEPLFSQAPEAAGAEAEAAGAEAEAATGVPGAVDRPHYMP